MSHTFIMTPECPCPPPQNEHTWGTDDLDGDCTSISEHSHLEWVKFAQFCLLAHTCDRKDREDEWSKSSKLSRLESSRLTSRKKKPESVFPVLKLSPSRTKVLPHHREPESLPTHSGLEPTHPLFVWWWLCPKHSVSESHHWVNHTGNWILTLTHARLEAMLCELSDCILRTQSLHSFIPQSVQSKILFWTTHPNAPHHQMAHPTSLLCAKKSFCWELKHPTNY